MRLRALGLVVAILVLILAAAFLMTSRSALAQAVDAATPIAESIETSTPTPSPTATATPTPTPTVAPVRARAAAVQAAASGVLPITVAPSPVSPILAGATDAGAASWASAPLGKPTGTVTYTAFNGGGCTGSHFASGGTFTVSSTGTYGSVAASTAIAFPAAGTYSWQASYSGDANYLPAAACADLTVNKYSPTIALTLSPTTITAAGSSAGSSTLTSSSSTAGGTAAYTVYSDSGCTTAYTVTGSPAVVTVTNKVVPGSGGITFSQAGTYYWKVVYSGDAANNGASSSCVALTVSKASPTLTLALSPVSPVTAGSAVSGVGALAGSVSNAGGTVTYTVYTSSACSTVYTLTGNPSAKTVTNGAAPASDALTFNTAGTFYWKAAYSGDANNNAASSACLALTVNKTAPTVAIGLLASSIVAGSTATATSTLTGATSVAGGTMTYTVYSDSGCATTYTVTGSPSAQTVTNGVAPNSAAITFNTAGTFYWKAAYGGDGGNTAASSSCIALTVNKTSPTVGLTTTPAGSVATTFTSTGTATLTGATTAAGGTVVYTVYTDSACTSVYTATGNPSSKTVTNHVPAVSAAITIGLAPGNVVYWQAAYSGDANNNGATSPCVAQNVVKASPTITETLSKTSIKAAATAYAKSTLTSSTAAAGGTVTYTAYTDSGCATVYSAANNPNVKTVTNKVVPNGTAVTFSSAGTFYWQAVYSGDANNNGATSACLALTVTLATPTLTLTTAASASPLKVGGTAYAKTTLGSATTTAGGTVTYTAYTDSGCATVYSAANNPSTKTVTNKTVPNSSLVTMGFVGTIYWKAAYTGDANNSAANSSCVAQTIAKATPTLTLTTAATTPPMVTGGTAYGSVTMTLASAAAGGTLTYTVYSDSSCATTLTAPGSPSAVTVTNAVVPNSAPVTITIVGTVYWKASYAGDAQNAAATSSCVSLAVAKTSPSMVLRVSPTNPPMAAGGTATGSVTISASTSDASGTVTYTVYTTNACTTQVSPPLTSAKTVTNNVAPASDAFTFNAIGTFYWKAVYSGDARNNTASSACVGLVVAGAASSTITLTLSPNPVAAGGSVIGDSNLAGTTGMAGGTVVYSVYSDSACTTQVVPAQTSTKTVVNANPPDSDSIVFTTVGTVYWTAAYSGDANNTAATSACIALTVTKATTVLDIGLTANPIEAGTGTAATGTLSGGVNAPGGTVTYTVYSNNACTTQVSPAKISTKTVTNGVVPNSDVFSFSAVGTYYWKSLYSGDASNNGDDSPCLALTVNKATPDIAVAQLPLPVNDGNNLTAHVTLSSDAVNPTGTSTLTYYSDIACTTQISGFSPYVATLSGGTIPDAPTFVYSETDPRYPNGIYWQAVYSGDANNAGVTSDCINVVEGQDLLLSLSLSPGTSIAHGASTTAQASWPADEGPTGTVAYAVYATADCTGAVFSGPETKTIANNAVAAASAVTFPNAGTYSWKATYPGDSAFNPASTCVALTVTKTTPTVSLSVSPNPIQAGQSAGAAATLSASVGGLTGTATYTVWTNNACTTPVNPAQQSVKTLVNNQPPASSSVVFLSSGILYWNAVYSGDGNNNAATSACVALTVNKATPALTMSQSPGAVAIGADFTMSFALSADAVSPTGTVTLTRYADSGCGSQLASVSPVTLTLSGGGVPDAPSLNVNFAGPVWQRAVYSGDANNAATATGCVAVSLVSGTLTASATSATLTPATYSNFAASGTGQIIVTVSDGRATWAGWSVTISASNFAYTGSSPRGAAIPAANFSITAAASPTLLSGQPIGAGGPLAGTSAAGPLNTTRTIATASSGYGSGAYQLALPVSLAIPAQSQAGAYVSTITVATSAAP